MRTKLAAAALAGTLLGGGAVGAALAVPHLASAQSSTTTQPSGQLPQSAQAPDAPPSFVTDALQKLVDAGTITQDQADAVAKALAEARPADGGGGPHGRHGGPGLDAAAAAIGITEDELHTALEGGQTIAQVAESKGVSVQTVVDALVAEMNARTDQALADGRITQAEADQRKADAAQRATDLVNGTRPAGPERHGPGGPPADRAPGSSTTPTTA